MNGKDKVNFIIYLFVAFVLGGLLMYYLTINTPTLQNTISQMRSAVTSILSTNSDIKSLFQIGISTTPYSATGSDNGKLIVDEEKLREAISNNMDDVAALFTNKPEYINGTVIDMENTKITQGSSFKITVDGKEETITFDKDYDLADTEQRNDMISNINSILSSKFGPRNITLAISSDRIVINSSKGNNITINSGESGADALAMLGLQDGAKFDGNALGFASKITNVMDTAMSSISEKAGTSANTVDTSTLGTRMKKLNDSQTIYLSLDKEDYIESSADSVELEKEVNWFQKIIEKIKDIF